MHYSDYFDIDRNYFPVVDESSIRAGLRWMDTYPHATFVDLLKQTERMLSRGSNTDKFSLWIEGAYGTGKSRVAWTLKNLMDCTEAEFNAYFERYEALCDETDLRTKLLTHKRSGKIVTTMRFSSSDVHGDQDLVLQIFDSLTKALKDAGCEYAGEKTLRGSIVRYLSGEAEKTYFTSLLKLPEYNGLGSVAGKSIDTIIAQLENPTAESGSLVRDILRIAHDRGVSGIALTVDDLVAWIGDVIERNALHAIVFVWDEFSDYFKNNRTALSGFQKLAALAKDKPFYLMIVTHESGSLLGTDQAARIVFDRFQHKEIEIPDTIAYELIRDALKVRKGQEDIWHNLSGAIASRTAGPREAVRKAAWGAHGNGEDVLRGILPIHPMAALLLKNISKNFASNQRSMFNFIKDDSDPDLRAFQWFIENRSPDEGDILGIDYLWDFFYEKGADKHTGGAGRTNLDVGIRVVLDTYAQNEDRLMEEERRVLKTVLMMQAMNANLGGAVPLFAVTKQNLMLAFEGIEGLENGRAATIADKLVRDEILFKRPTAGGGEEYNARTTASNLDKIPERIGAVRNSLRTSTLAQTAGLKDVLPLTPAQKFRYSFEVATVTDFTTVANRVANKPADHRIWAMLCIAMDDAEGGRLRDMMRDAINNERKPYKRIVFVDATQNVLGAQRKEQWIEYTAYQQALAQQDQQQADQAGRDANGVLSTWKNDFANGPYTIHWDGNPAGKNAQGTSAVVDALKEIVGRRYPNAFDNKCVAEQMFATSALKDGALRGIRVEAGNRFQAGILAEVLGPVQGVERYWENAAFQDHPLTALKKAVDKKIQQGFRQCGEIAVGDIIDLLVDKGFMPCNLYAFLTGFLLKEYAKDPYRWSDGNTSGTMDADKLADHVQEYIKNLNAPMNNYHPKTIQEMTAGQRVFVAFAKDAFGLQDDQSVDQTGRSIGIKIRELGYPLWCLKSTDTRSLGSVLDKLGELCNPPAGTSIMDIASALGNLVQNVPGASAALRSMLTRERAGEAMREFLESFDGRAVLNAAERIVAEDVLGDIRRIFSSGDGAWLWDQAIGEAELRKLGTDYLVVAESNDVLNRSAHSFPAMLEDWRSAMQAVHIPCADLAARYGDLSAFFQSLKRVVQNGELLYDRREAFLLALRGHAADLRDLLGPKTKDVFRQIYATNLGTLNDVEVGTVFARLDSGSFTMSRTDFIQRLAEAVDAVRREQSRYRLQAFWQEKTGTQTPRAWSQAKRTPALAVFPVQEEANARRALGAIDNNTASQADVDFALEYLHGKDGVLAVLADAAAIDAAFKARVLGRNAVLLADLDNVRLHLEQSAVPHPADWLGDSARQIVETLAMAAYSTSGRQKVRSIIDGMDPAQLKEYLKRLVDDNVRVGVEILEAQP